MSNTHIHNIKIKSGNTISIKEQIFRLKKIYCYLPRKKSFMSDTRSRKLINIGFICLYCSETSFNQDYLDYKQHLTDQA